MMVVIGVILLLKLLPKIGKFVPSSSIAGFLFVLGIFKPLYWMRRLPSLSMQPSAEPQWLSLQ